jgi:dolichol kinase
VGRIQGANQISFKGELLRKLTHLFALVIPSGYYLFQLSRAEALAIMIPITIVMIIIDIGRLRDWKIWDLLKKFIAPIIREHEMMGDFTGASYILATSCFAIALFSKPVAMAALAFIMAGDPAAAIIGRRFGRIKYGNKSLEGSLSFLAAAIIVVLVAPGIPFGIGLVGALTAAITEGLSTGVDDNATVPLVSGLAMELLLRMGVMIS